jgi:hypothetical protein
MLQLCCEATKEQFWPRCGKGWTAQATGPFWRRCELKNLVVRFRNRNLAREALKHTELSTHNKKPLPVSRKELASKLSQLD